MSRGLRGIVNIHGVNFTGSLAKEIFLIQETTIIALFTNE